jgi:hypothetical protein
MVPDFPDFESLSLSHRQIIEEYLLADEPYSDFTFTNLWIWDIENSVKISKLRGNLVFRLYNYTGEYEVLSINGTSQIEESISELLAYVNSKEDLGNSLEYIHSGVAELLKGSDKYAVTEARDNFDYIISVKDALELGGKEHGHKRRKINQFSTLYGSNASLRQLDLGDAQIKEAVLSVFDSWASSREKDEKETLDERLAIVRLLENSESLNIEGLGLWINEKLEAFSIFEFMHNNYVTYHLEKTNANFSGIVRYLQHAVSESLQTRGVTHINYEQDLGIAGLRKAKLELHPEKLLKKYTVSLNEPAGTHDS